MSSSTATTDVRLLNLSLLPCHVGNQEVGVGSQFQTHLKDGSAYRQLRPTKSRHDNRPPDLSGGLACWALLTFC